MIFNNHSERSSVPKKSQECTVKAVMVVSQQCGIVVVNLRWPLHVSCKTSRAYNERLKQLTKRADKSSNLDNREKQMVHILFQ